MLQPLRAWSFNLTHGRGKSKYRGQRRKEWLPPEAKKAALKRVLKQSVRIQSFSAISDQLPRGQRRWLPSFHALRGYLATNNVGGNEQCGQMQCLMGKSGEAKIRAGDY